MNDTKQPLHTLLEIVKHVSASHPELLPTIQKILFPQHENMFDANVLLTLNEELLKKSKAQLRQDLFVLSELNYKKQGYFVEFGATNGIELSNTYLLESEYGWTGILAEPATLWHEDLRKNRTSHIDTRCVWKSTGETLLFNQTNYAELSTIDTLSSSDHHARAREGGKKYAVQTISLMDLLEEYRAPHEIDYLSIDTEGSEFDILEHFDFQKYRFKVITCEHNYSPTREKLNILFRANGYHRKYEHLSQFDDWWVFHES